MTLCRSFRRLIHFAHLHDLAPHGPLDKAVKFSEELGNLRDIVLEGRATDYLRYVPYRSLDEVAVDHPKFMEDTCKKMNITSYQSLWRLLRQAYPYFKKSKAATVALREPEQARAAADQLRGERAVPFEYIAKDPILKHHPLMNRFLQPGFEFFFTITMLVFNVFLDATKIEPQRWARQRKVITYRGWKGGPCALVHSLIKLSVCHSQLKHGAAWYVACSSGTPMSLDC